MNGRSYFSAVCRDCERTIVITVPAEDSYTAAHGIHGRCGECGRTEWLTKATQEDLEGAVIDRIYLIEKAVNLINGLFARFI